MSAIVQRSVSLPVPRYPLEELERRLEVYREATPTPTWAGTAAFLGISRGTLDAYAAGQINSSEKDGIADALGVHKTHIEAYLESVLTREKGSPAGAQFALKSQHNWRDTLNIEINDKPQLSIVVEGALAQLLANRDIADAEIIEDDDDSWLG